MSLFKSEQPEIEDILFRTLDRLSKVALPTEHAGASLRQQIGKVRSYYIEMMTAGTFGDELMACFSEAYDAKASLLSIADVRQQLFAESPSGLVGSYMVMSAIMFCLATECRLILAITFVSRDDVDAMMKTYKTAFDTARDLAADAIDSATYQALTFLGGAVINHLATTARPLPRMISFSLRENLPALALSQRLYYVADRSDELVKENHIVHPAFCLREIRGLNR